MGLRFIFIPVQPGNIPGYIYILVLVIILLLIIDIKYIVYFVSGTARQIFICMSVQAGIFRDFKNYYAWQK